MKRKSRPDRVARRDVADEIEIELLVVDCVRYAGEQERVSVWRRIHYQFGADIAGGTRPVLDLAKPLRERLADQACSDVGPTPAAKLAMMRTGRVG